jgi:hypothetical protein
MALKDDEQQTRDLAIFKNFHIGLVQVHDELRQGVNSILDGLVNIANNANSVDILITSFSETLLNHHKSEDSFFFPAFRISGRLRSSDIAFLDARDLEHQDIHRLCLELRKLSDNHLHGMITTSDFCISVKSVITDLGSISLPHFEIEEITLTSEHVATIITSKELESVYRDMGEHWNRR